MKKTVVIADIHAGIVRDTWWLRADAEEITERSIANMAMFLLEHRGDIRRVIFNGDILHAWRASDYDWELAKKQLEPLRSALQTLGVPVFYLEGNADDRIGAASEDQKREILRGVDLEFPGLAWRDDEEGILAVHGHIFDPDRAWIAPLSLTEFMTNILSRISGKSKGAHRKDWSRLFPSVEHIRHYKQELCESLAQALSGDPVLAQKLCQRSLDRHGGAVKPYENVVKIIRTVFPKRLASLIEEVINHSKDTVAESIFPSAGSIAISGMQAKEHLRSIRTLILSHTHVPSIHDCDELPSGGGAGTALRWVANTGTPNRRQDAVGTFLVIEDGKPTMMRCYHPNGTGTV